MQKLSRHQEREQVFHLLFETIFREGEDPSQIYAIAKDEKDLPDVDYIKNAYFGTLENLGEIDALINTYAKGRSATQMSNVIRSILRLAVYEIKYIDDIKPAISINEAVELAKKYEDVRLKGYVNGVLHSIYKDVYPDESSNEEK